MTSYSSFDRPARGDQASRQDTGYHIEAQTLHYCCGTDAKGLPRHLDVCKKAQKTDQPTHINTRGTVADFPLSACSPKSRREKKRARLSPRGAHRFAVDRQTPLKQGDRVLVDSGTLTNQSNIRPAKATSIGVGSRLEIQGMQLRPGTLCRLPNDRWPPRDKVRPPCRAPVAV